MPNKLIRVLIALLVILLAGTAILPASLRQEETPTPSAELEATSRPDLEATPDSKRLRQYRLTLVRTFREAAASVDLSTLEPIDLLRLIVAVTVILVFVLFGRRIVTGLLNRFAKRTATSFDDELIERIQGQIRWLVVIFGIDIGTSIIFFGNDAIRDVFDNVLFWFYYGFLISAPTPVSSSFLSGMKTNWMKRKPRRGLSSHSATIRHGALYYSRSSNPARSARSHITGLAAAAALVGLAIALAAQDVIGDLISGYVILMDRSFRVGDRIDIPGQDAWGDVVEIGTRTTRIRTRDNNLVIIPNSEMADGQILNYTYPDPNYRPQSDIGIGYGQDLDRIKQVLGAAVRSVDEVLKDQPIQVLFIEFAPATMTIPSALVDRYLL